MGADRRGPLAAFIILAVIAVILLVTSVRSQAAPGWFRTTVVAGHVARPDAWAPDVTQVVQEGVVLARKAAADTSRPEHHATASPGVSPSVVPQRAAPATSSARHQVAGAPRPDHPTGAPTDQTTTWGTHDHGRHLGWYKSRGRDATAAGAGHPRGHDHGRGWLPVGVGSHGRGH